MRKDRQWMNADKAIEISKDNIVSYGLNRDPNVESVIQTGKPGRPLLVNRLDNPGDAYYLVPWMDAEKVALIVQIHALSGDMLCLTTFPKPIPSPLLTPEEALSYATKKFPEHAFGGSQLVWLPCRESVSPVRPFYQISYPGGSIYVNMDGLVFPKPTPLGLGGKGSRQIFNAVDDSFV